MQTPVPQWRRSELRAANCSRGGKWARVATGGAGDLGRAPEGPLRRRQFLAGREVGKGCNWGRGRSWSDPRGAVAALPIARQQVGIGRRTNRYIAVTPLTYKQSNFNLLWNTPLRLRHKRFPRNQSWRETRVHASFVTQVNCNCGRGGPRRTPKDPLCRRQLQSVSGA